MTVTLFPEDTTKETFTVEILMLLEQILFRLCQRSPARVSLPYS
jgi:hypothetical protein